jgi:hypothetical protein
VIVRREVSVFESVLVSTSVVVSDGVMVGDEEPVRETRNVNELVFVRSKVSEIVVVRDAEMDSVKVLVDDGGSDSVG